MSELFELLKQILELITSSENAFLKVLTIALVGLAGFAVYALFQISMKS